MKIFFSFFFSLFFLPVFAQIKADPSKTFLQTKEGKPFFWMADTGWKLFHRLSRQEAVHYLDVRNKQHFNVIFAVAFEEVTGPLRKNYYGDEPFKNLKTLEFNTTRGNDFRDSVAYDYWDHADYIINEAQKRNMYIALLFTWGDKVTMREGDTRLFTNDSIAYHYAKTLVSRYKDKKNVIWMLGGDRPAIESAEINGVVKQVDYRPIWRAMANAILETCGKETFIGYHPGWHTSEYFGEEDSWLSINAIQSGHANRELEIWDSVRTDLKTNPKRPFMDMEPCYEDHPVNPWDGKWTRAGRGYFNDYDLRARIYRGVFAGGCGAVYGHHQVWQFLDTTRNPPVWIGDYILGWQKALHSPAAYQMQHLKNLMLSYSDFNRVEDSLLIASYRGNNYKDAIIATRNQKGTYAMVYLPRPEKIKINLDRLKKGTKRITWFNPSTGDRAIIRKKYNSGIETFFPPDINQKDWVLMVDVL